MPNIGGYFTCRLANIESLKKKEPLYVVWSSILALLKRWPRRSISKEGKAARVLAFKMSGMAKSVKKIRGKIIFRLFMEKIWRICAPYKNRLINRKNSVKNMKLERLVIIPLIDRSVATEVYIVAPNARYRGIFAGEGPGISFALSRKDDIPISAESIKNPSIMTEAIKQSDARK